MRFLFFLFLSLGISAFALIPTSSAAGFCRDVAGWQKSNVACDIEYSDSGGGGLQKCLYRIESYGTTTYKYPSAGENYGGEYWAKTPGTCTGDYARLTTTLYVGNLLDCRDNGIGKCKLFAKAFDSPNNEQSQKEIVLLDIDYTAPSVSANNASSSWFTSRTTTLSASDTGGSGLAEARYSWDTNGMNSSCTSGGATFVNDAVLTVPQGSHRLYLCSRDGAGNVTNWDSLADQYRVDPIAPVYQSFTVNGVSCSSNGPVFCPATVTATGTISFTWGVSDSGGSGLQKHELWRARDASENNGNWVWQNIQPNLPPLSFSTTDIPPNKGTWWYGMHALDNALHADNSYNCITEKGEHICGGVSSDSLDDRTARGPIKVKYGDQIAPTIDSFSISPTGWTNGSITVSWTVQDSGGSYLKEVSVLRCDKTIVSQCGVNDWQVRKTVAAPLNSNGPWTSSWPDSPPEGTFWYGMHVWDNAENKTVEPNPPGPLQALVDKTPPLASTLITPINNQVITISQPSFDWNDATDLSGIISYRIHVNNTPNHNNLEIDEPTVNSSYASTRDLSEGNQYWWVTATNGAGLPSDYSSRGDFQIQLNEPPNASFNCTPGSCTVYNTETLTFNNNSTDPDGSSDITKSEWDILSWGASPDATCTSPNALCNHTLQPIGPNTYTMQLKVQDAAGVSDTDTRSFTVKHDIVAGFMCSLDNVNFIACSSLSGKISQEEVLYLKDSSSLSEYTVVSQGASSVTSRTWKINGSTFGGNTSNPSTAIPTQGTITLELTAQDNQGRSDTQTHTLNPQVPFPEFQEISPF